MTYTLRLRPVVEAGSYELLQEATVRGTLAKYTTEPRIVTDTGAWDLSVRRTRFGWYAVATRDQAPVADAAYYPGWISGGTIAFEPHRYRLRHAFLADRWRLRDDDRMRVGTIRTRQPDRHEKGPKLPPEFTGEFDPQTAARPEMPLLFVIAAWSILTRSPAVSAPAGGN